jgi:hypothetical protein
MQADCVRGSVTGRFGNIKLLSGAKVIGNEHPR